MSKLTNEEMTNELMRDLDLRPIEPTSIDAACDGALPNAWRRRLSAIRTNEFVKTCLLSLIACGPIPPVQARRHH